MLELVAQDALGLESERVYHAEAMARVLEDGELEYGEGVDRLADTDLLFSDAFVHLAHHLARGAVDPSVQSYERTPDRGPDPATELALALTSGEIGGALARMAPPYPEYAALVRALERVRAATGEDASVRARADQVRANLER